MNTDPWPRIPHAVPHTPPILAQSKETVASVNAFLLKMTLEIAQENINCIKNGNRQDLTFDAQLSIVKKIAKFFNPTWK